MRQIPHLKSLFVSLFVIAISAIITVPVHAQGTTSSIRVEVTDETGNRVGNVPVQITHVPTGRIQTVTANASGIVTLGGLAVGGPYTVSIPAGASYATDAVTDIILKLDETEVIPLSARSATLEEIIVTAEMVAERQIVGVGTRLRPPDDRRHAIPGQGLRQHARYRAKNSRRQQRCPRACRVNGRRKFPLQQRHD